VAKVGNFHPTPQVSTKQGFAEYPLRHSMDMVELGARSMDLVDLEFLELGCSAGKKWSGAVFCESGVAWSSPKHALTSEDTARWPRRTATTTTEMATNSGEDDI
jgi:hypothetical protein